MLKKLTAICLLAAMISSNCSRVFIYAGFEANQKYIAKYLCVNKNRPSLHCNGKCYFMKKLKQADENEKKQEAKDNLNKIEVSLFQEPFQLAFIKPTIIAAEKGSFPAYYYRYSSRYIETIFRPPKLAA